MTETPIAWKTYRGDGYVFTSEKLKILFVCFGDVFAGGQSWMPSYWDCSFDEHHEGILEFDMDRLRSDKVGVRVTCAVCGHQKIPHGRSGPVGAYYCNYPLFGQGCHGYMTDPQVGDLWPGESEADFGYPASDNGTEIRS